MNSLSFDSGEVIAVRADIGKTDVNRAAAARTTSSVLRSSAGCSTFSRP
jgi:hypothetical protein